MNAITLAGAVAVIGVPPALQNLYEPIVKPNGDWKWKCLNSSVEINWHQINDDYCDCPDGSDEPGTNACETSLGFYCDNHGFFPSFIDNSKVNDGVCDYDLCCDGSDEYLTGVCPNKCQQVREQYDTYRAETLGVINQAIHAQQEILKRAKVHRQKAHTNFDVLSLHHNKMSHDIEQLQLRLKSTKQDSVFNEISEYTARVEEDGKKLMMSYDISTQRLRALETMLAKLMQEYNPNFNDAAVKETVNGFQNYLSNKKESRFDGDIIGGIHDLNHRCKAIKVTGTSETPSISGLIHHYIDKLFHFFAEEENVEPVSSSESDRIQSQLDAMIKELTTTERNLKLVAQDLEADYGPNDILRGVLGEWITGKNGGYEYKIGILDSVYQDNTLLGSYKGYEDGILKYENGHKCWNGPHRRAHVKLACGIQPQIVLINEPEKCMYEFVVMSPLGCGQITEEDIRRDFKVDYQRL